MNTPTIRDPKTLEKYSSAVTLSDMEIFVFPELMYSLLLANIMSPIIWQWRDDPWFAKIDSMKPYKRILRLKQFIMEKYVFNLDLDTWGLTTQAQELARFKDIIDTNELEKANALFGYHGDKYYFDVNIRKHFGLDKYEGDVIPYWKTETVEAMSAFRHKDNYSSGAGECVSLAALYAAALFIIAKIPLSDIYMMATPLHSQNYVHIRDGILTNNRRLVTKNMWINGTEISAKARRAIENEQITIVSHESGFIHVLYPEATIDPKSYASFSKNLTAFVQTELTPTVLGNFMRYRLDLQKCFQIRWDLHGKDYYIAAEKVFAYEQSSPYLFTSANRALFMEEIDCDEFHPELLPMRIVFTDLEKFIEERALDLSCEEDMLSLRKRFETDCMNAVLAIESLINFCRVWPRLPDARAKKFTQNATSFGITPDMERQAIIERLQRIRTENETAELAFYAWRDLSSTESAPFIKAALERNPVVVEATAGLSIEAIIAKVDRFAHESIYPGPARAAQPDEVWNFSRGDGIEKALTIATILKNRPNSERLSIEITKDTATLRGVGKIYTAQTTKGLAPQTWDL
jgi:hypothetical protein